MPLPLSRTAIPIMLAATIPTDGHVMASFRGHLAFSASLGAALGGLSWWQLGYDPGTAALAGGLTAVGGMMPDLVVNPLRELVDIERRFAG